MSAEPVHILSEHRIREIIREEIAAHEQSRSGQDLWAEMTSIAALGPDWSRAADFSERVSRRLSWPVRLRSAFRGALRQGLAAFGSLRPLGRP